jgi:hypothetical protein
MPKVVKQILRRLQSRIPRRRHQHAVRKIDTLEVRILPTAVVNFTGSAMTVTGDTTDNVITMTRVGSQLHVDANGGLITVAGSDVPSFDFNLNGAFNLTATFQGGSDALEIVGPLQLKSVSVNLGDGITNTFAMVDTTLSGKLTVTGGDGVDVVVLQTVSVAGNTLMNLGWNADVAEIIDGTYTGSTTINTDLGDDVVVLTAGSPATRAKFVGKLTVSTGDDTDVVQMVRTDTKAVSIDTGDGDDVVITVDQILAGGLTVKTGAGTDIVNVLQVVQSGTAANLIDTGSGQDVAQLSVDTITGATTVNLGSGTPNALLIDDVGFTNTFTLNTQGTGDVTAVEQDTAQTGATTFSKAAKFNFGVSNVMAISTADPATKTKFLSSVAFTGRSAVTIIAADPANTSFAVGPTLKNVLLV